jgi:PhnB protein
MSFDPYLFFSGNCREAMTRYQEIFGGELSLMPMSDAPPEVQGGMPGATQDMIMHGALTLNGRLLMASDDPTGDGGPKKGVAVSHSAADAGEAKRVLEALAEGGEITMPLAETFWSPAFGMCNDRFGVPWMVGVEPQQG